MRFYVNVNASPRQTVKGLGSTVPVTSYTVKRRDSAAVELQLFTGEQGSAVPVKLEDSFEVRFACKVKDDFTAEAVVLSMVFDWVPAEQVYQARPSFNTTQLNDLFAAVDDVEPGSVTLMGEFSWRELSRPAEWTSTASFAVVVENDVIRGDEADPSNAEDPSAYALLSELNSGFVRTDVVQSLSSGQKSQARQNIGAVESADVVLLAAQSLSGSQQTQARTNIAAASTAALASTNADLASAVASLAALTTTVGTKAAQSALDAAIATITALSAIAVKHSAQTLTEGQKTQARANIGAAASGTAGGRRVITSWNPVGDVTTISLDGALTAAAGTATARKVEIGGPGVALTNAVSTTQFNLGSGHPFANGDKVALRTTVTLPAPLSYDTWYYIVGLSGDVCSLALTAGGTPITRTAAGSGTHTIAKPGGAFSLARRIGYVSSTTAATYCGVRHGQRQWAIDAAAGSWVFTARFGISDAVFVSTSGLFVGLSATSAALGNIDPANLLNCIGVGVVMSGSTLGIIHNDSAGAATVYDLGSNFPGNTTNVDWYELRLATRADGTAVDWSVRRLNTGHETTGAISTNMPASSVLMGPQFWRGKTGSAAKVGLDVGGWQIDADV